MLFRSGTCSPLTSPNAGPSLYNANFDFAGLAAYNIYTDGVKNSVDCTYSTKLDTPQDLKIFVNRGNSKRPDGFFAELIITENVTEAKRLKITSHLMTKWGL